MTFACRNLLSTVFVLCVATAMADDPAVAATSEASVSPATMATMEQARDHFVSALKSEGKDRLQGLRASYAKLVEAADADPTLPPARTMWAKMMASAGDQKSATRALQQAVSEAPGDPEAYVLLGNQAARAGQLTEAQLAYEAATRLSSDWSESNRRRSGIRAQVASGMAAIAKARGALATQSGLTELADEYDAVVLDQLRQWVAVVPNNASAHDQLAAALLKQGDLKAAVESFDRARELNPKLPLTDLRLAQSQIINGDEEGARASLKRAVAEAPDDAAVQLTAADLMLVMGDLEAAAAQIEKARELAPDLLAANRLHAQLLRFRGEWAEAAEELQGLSNDHPTDFETANLLALTLSEMAAEETRRRAMSVATVTAQRFDGKTSQGRRARISLIWAAYAAGETEAAKKALSQLLSNGIESNQISGDEGYFLARLLVEFGRPELAAPMLNSVLSRVGAFPKRADAETLQTQLN